MLILLASAVTVYAGGAALGATPWAQQPVDTRDAVENDIRALELGRPVERGLGEGEVLNVPASALRTGEYELALKGVTDKGEEDVGYYYFSVQKE